MFMSLAYYLQKIHAHEPLSESEAAAACEILMRQDIGSPASGAYLMALSQRGETMEEMVGMALNMRKRTSALPIDVACCDILSCATIDSVAAVILGASLLLATAGIPISKLLTRANGVDADMWAIAASLGITPASSPAAAAAMLRANGFSLLDPADYIENLRSIRSHQESLSIPTIFDRLMALSHPVNLQSLLLGVAPVSAALPITQALRRLRVPRALILAAENGSCPFSHSNRMHLVELADGRITQDDIQPADFGLDMVVTETQTLPDSEKQAAWLRALIDGRDNPLKGPVIWTAALGLYTAGKVENLSVGIDKAKDILASGRIAGIVAIVSRGSRSV